MSDKKENIPTYKNLRYFSKQYGRKEVLDQRAAQDFVEVEPDYIVKSLKAELLGILHGKYNDKTMDALVGLPRKVRHGSYEEWARLMLLWMAEYHKKA